MWVPGLGIVSFAVAVSWGQDSDPGGGSYKGPAAQLLQLLTLGHSDPLNCFCAFYAD